MPLPPGWPLTAIFVFFPVWWALGLSEFILPILAVPMALHLLRRAPIKVPPGFGIWMLFLLWVVVGAVVLNVNPPDTLPGSAASRSIAFTHRLVNYLAVTVAMLYIGNLSERELPRYRLIRMLGIFFMITVAGGLLAIARPTFEFTSPFEMLLPSSLTANPYVQSLVHPAVAQIQDVLGFDAPRPKAPFDYTNTWGNNLSILGIWFVVGWWARRPVNPRSRLFAAAVVLAAVIPAVYSLNRGMWIGVGLSLGYVALRLAARGRVAVLGALAVAVAVGLLIFAVSPLHTVVEERLENPRSNEIRATLSIQAVQHAADSPIIGYGSTRTALGSNESIAIGRSSSCPQCGNFTIGSNGHLWFLLIANGFVGAALYVLFFLGVAWRYRRDVTPIGIAGTLVALLALFYGLFYNALVTPLLLYLTSVALLWRNETHRREEEAREGGGAA
ncbi:MAG: hypothetical protein GEV03_20535 [Streptosporangiales bacterium]|nr:hypothetical protein [Streptosporangiales bacterium]